MDDRDAFEALYELHYRPVCRYLARRTAAEAVEDLAAETFLIAWRRRGELPEPPLPWLYATAAKCLANHRRGQARRVALVELLAAQPVLPVQDPGEQTAVLTRRRALYAALDAMRSGDRELLMLRHWEQLPVREMAIAAGIGPDAARQRLHRAERRLAATLRRIEAADAACPLPPRTLTPMEGTTHVS